LGHLDGCQFSKWKYDRGRPRHEPFNVHLGFCILGCRWRADFGGRKLFRGCLSDSRKKHALADDLVIGDTDLLSDSVFVS
jgi:hypothetical protein